MDSAGENISTLLYRLVSSKSEHAEPVEAIGLHYCSNGLTWSLDGKKFYYVDSIENIMKEYDYDTKTGAITGGKEIFKNTEENGGGGFLDGSTMDT